MMLIGSSIEVAPIVEWDRKPIGDGKPGPVAQALRELLKEDMRSGRERLIEVPYRRAPGTARGHQQGARDQDHGGGAERQRQLHADHRAQDADASRRCPPAVPASTC